MTTPERPPDNTTDWAWSDLSRSVFTFARALRAADLMPDDEDEYWERPCKWDREHQLWVNAGEPSSPDKGAPASLAWERFARAATTANAK